MASRPPPPPERARASAPASGPGCAAVPPPHNSASAGAGPARPGGHPGHPGCMVCMVMHGCMSKAEHLCSPLPTLQTLSIYKKEPGTNLKWRCPFFLFSHVGAGPGGAELSRAALRRGSTRSPCIWAILCLGFPLPEPWFSCLRNGVAVTGPEPGAAAALSGTGGAP